MSHGSNPAGFQAPVEVLCRAEQLLYLPSEMQSGAGDGRKADGGGNGTDPSPRNGVRFSWQGATGGREPSLCTHGVRHHHHINNERAAPSKLFAPAPARAQNAEEVREPHPKQLQGERLRCPAGPLLGCCPGVTKTCQVPPSPVTLPAGSLATGESLRESGASRSVPQVLSPSLPCVGSPVTLFGGDEPFRLAGKEHLLQGQSALSII